MRKVALVLLLAWSTVGCGSGYYTAQIFSAQSKLEQARTMGAEQLAPYEFYCAEEHYKKAQEEAAEASYGDAANFAETSEQFAQKAIEIVQQRAPAKAKAE